MHKFSPYIGGRKPPRFEDRPEIQLMDVFHQNPISQTGKITCPTTACMLTQLPLTGKGQFYAWNKSAGVDIHLQKNILGLSFPTLDKALGAWFD